MALRLAERCLRHDTQGDAINCLRYYARPETLYVHARDNAIYAFSLRRCARTRRRRFRRRGLQHHCDLVNSALLSGSFELVMKFAGAICRTYPIRCTLSPDGRYAAAAPVLSPPPPVPRCR
jgi:hypothetical protein